MLDKIIMGLLNFANTYCWKFVGITILAYALVFIFTIMIAYIKDSKKNKKLTVFILSVIDYLSIVVGGITFYISVFCAIGKIILLIL